MDSLYSKILILFFLFLVVCTIGFRLLLNDKKKSYSHTHDESKCRKLSDLLNIKQKFTLVSNPSNSFNYQLGIKELLNSFIQKKCPTEKNDIEFLYAKELISYTESYLNSYTVYDCHGSPYLKVNYKPENNNPSYKSYKLMAEIKSADTNDYLYGYIVDNQKGGYFVMDTSEKILVNMNREGLDLAWDIQILVLDHPASDSNFLLMFLGKQFIQNMSEKDTDDGCNVNYANANLCYSVLLLSTAITLILLTIKYVIDSIYIKHIDRHSEHEPLDQEMHSESH